MAVFSEVAMVVDNSYNVSSGQIKRLFTTATVVEV